MIVMLEITTRLVLETYHSRYMALLEGRLERDNTNRDYKPLTGGFSQIYENSPQAALRPVSL